MYPMLKHTHMLFALISITGFIVRSAWAFQGSPLLDRKIVRIAPHIIDTLLLLSAIGLMLSIQQYPFLHGWLTAKFLGLLAYIVLGVMTLKKAKNNQQRAVFFVLAVASFVFIAGVARTKNPLLFL